MSYSCEMPKTNTTSEETRNILKNSRVIAVVGLSNDVYKDSYMVAKYMQDNGYKIIPVNPKLCVTSDSTLLGEKCYANLNEIPVKVDIVNVFRKPEAVVEIAEQAIAIKANVLWLQSGIVNNEAAMLAKESGLEVVQSKCLMVEHRLGQY